MQVLEDNRLEITTTIADGMSPKDYPDIKSDFMKEVYLFFCTGTFFVIMGRTGKLRKRFLQRSPGVAWRKQTGSSIPKPARKAGKTRIDA